MLCELNVWGNFFITWFALSVIGWISLMLLSGAAFVRYYVNPTYENWRYKSNPEFPEPSKVKEEIYLMSTGLFAATLCPALALYLAQHGLSQAYCGFETYGWGYHIFSFFMIWIGTDLWSFLYHYLGHSSSFMWNAHKIHHTLYNPSPFAVIADEYTDQFLRAAPLLLFPLIMPTNIDLMFAQFVCFFYLYGVYLHWGFELESPNAHHPWINTSYQHYLHHARSVQNVPYHTGFFFKIWDQIAGSIYRGECLCSKCAREKGKRTPEQWKAIKKPDYSVLLQPSFWLSNGEKQKS